MVPSRVWQDPRSWNRKLGELVVVVERDGGPRGRSDHGPEGELNGWSLSKRRKENECRGLQCVAKRMTGVEDREPERKTRAGRREEFGADPGSRNGLWAVRAREGIAPSSSGGGPKMFKLGRGGTTQGAAVQSPVRGRASHGPPIPSAPAVTSRVVEPEGGKGGDGVARVWSCSCSCHALPILASD